MKTFAFISAVLFCLSVNLYAATYGGGSGTTTDPYLIYTPEQMNTIGTNSGDWGSCFKLMADIDMVAYTGTQYNIIGNLTTKFTGTFDGNDHTISNLTYSTTASVTYVGLFGYTNNATIKNTGLEGITITGTNYSFAGGLIGYQKFGTLTNCFGEGTVNVLNNGYMGGVVGYSENGTIDSCYFNGLVKATYFSNDVGGLIGYQQQGTITNCFSKGNVIGILYTGGLVGALWNGTLSYCYSTSDVSGELSAGGLVGNKSGGTISYCYSINSVSLSVVGSMGDVSAGGLVGYQSYGSISDCYSVCQVSSSFSNTSTYVYGSAAGGLAGRSDNGTITRCYSAGSVYSLIPTTATNAYTAAVGGLVGYQGVNSISLCYSTCIVDFYSEVYISSSPVSVGGLVGRQEGSSSVVNCYSTGDVSCNAGYSYFMFLQQYLGGLIGVSANYSTVTKSYSTGAVVTTASFVHTGGLLGSSGAGAVTSCFWDKETSGQTTSPGGTGMTTAEMQTLSIFTAASWDFLDETTNGTNDYWRMCVSDANYPKLTWQHIEAGDFACPDGVSTDDLQRLSEDWLLTYSTGLYGADANDDGTVNLSDFAILAQYWLD